MPASERLRLARAQHSGEANVTGVEESSNGRWGIEGFVKYEKNTLNIDYLKYSQTVSIDWNTVIAEWGSKHVEEFIQGHHLKDAVSSDGD